MEKKEEERKLTPIFTVSVFPSTCSVQVWGGVGGGYYGAQKITKELIRAHAIAAGRNGTSLILCVLGPTQRPLYEALYLGVGFKKLDGYLNVLHTERAIGDEKGETILLGFNCIEQSEEVKLAFKKRAAGAWNSKSLSKAEEKADLLAREEDAREEELKAKRKEEWLPTRENWAAEPCFCTPCHEGRQVKTARKVA